jgi:hypothetical protein
MEDALNPVLLGLFFIATFSICLSAFSIVMVSTLNNHFEFLFFLAFFLSSLYLFLASPSFLCLFLLLRLTFRFLFLFSSS